jgi:glutaredoxin-like YruB-family protein
MKSLTVYTLPTCGWCQLAKEFLRKHNVDFVEKDVSQDKDAAAEMVAVSGQMGVPVFVIGEGAQKEVLVGFEEQKLTRLLGISSAEKE